MRLLPHGRVPFQSVPGYAASPHRNAHACLQGGGAHAAPGPGRRPTAEPRPARVAVDTAALGLRLTDGNPAHWCPAGELCPLAGVRVKTGVRAGVCGRVWVWGRAGGGNVVAVWDCGLRGVPSPMVEVAPRAQLHVHACARLNMACAPARACPYTSSCPPPHFPASPVSPPPRRISSRLVHDPGASPCPTACASLLIGLPAAGGPAAAAPCRPTAPGPAARPTPDIVAALFGGRGAADIHRDPV